MTNDDDRTKPASPEVDAPEMLREMFGSPRALADAAAGPLLFALVNARWGLTSAAIVAGGLGAALAVYRLARKQQASQAIFGLVGSLIAIAIALLTKSASAYFVPGTVIAVVAGLVTLVTAAVGYPITAIVAQAIQRYPAEWYKQKGVRASHTILTVAWALVLFARAGYRMYLIRNERTVALGLASLLLGYPVTAAFLLGGIGFLKLRGHGGRLRADVVVSTTPPEPVPDEVDPPASAEPGDAASDDAEPDLAADEADPPIQR